LLSQTRRNGTHNQNVYATLPVRLLFSAVYLKHSSSQSTGVYSALEALATTRCIGLSRRFTLQYNYELC